MCVKGQGDLADSTSKVARNTAAMNCGASTANRAGDAAGKPRRLRRGSMNGARGRMGNRCVERMQRRHASTTTPDGVVLPS